MENQSADPFNLSRFLGAQDGMYELALAELKRGSKESHWMWFIFPQIEGLGKTPASRHYSIKSADEAKAYLEHPILGQRLLECCEALLGIDDRNASNIFGFPDVLKLKSCMTLFASVSESRQSSQLLYSGGHTEPDSVFVRVLAKYYNGESDEKTIALLSK